MHALDSVAFLELFRENLNEIRELSGETWPAFIRQVQPILLEMAITRDFEKSRDLVNELIARSLAAPAAAFIGKLIIEYERTRQEITRSGGLPTDMPNSEEDASGAAAAAAASLFEWLTPTDQHAYRSVPVFFATDRRPTGSDNPNKFFGGERGGLRYGVVRVSIPDRHETGHIERPWKLLPESPKRHVTLLGLKQMRPHDFLEDVNSALKLVSARKVLVFVHGYRVPFADAARTIAQVVSDLNFTGIPILYSWPSKGSFFGIHATRRKWDGRASTFSRC